MRRKCWPWVRRVMAIPSEEIARTYAEAAPFAKLVVPVLFTLPWPSTDPQFGGGGCCIRLKIETYAARNIEPGAPCRQRRPCLFCRRAQDGDETPPAVGRRCTNSNGSIPASATSRAPSPAPADLVVPNTLRAISSPMNTASTAASNSTTLSNASPPSRPKPHLNPAKASSQRKCRGNQKTVCSKIAQSEFAKTASLNYRATLRHNVCRA